VAGHLRNLDRHSASEGESEDEEWGLGFGP
jgi:hypothetical protein